MSVLDYLDRLETEPNKANLIVSMINELFGYDTFRKHNLFIIVNKLIKGYGPQLTMLGFMDVYDVYANDSLDTNKSPYMLTAYFIKKRIESRNSVYKKENDLTKFAESIRKDSKKIPKIIKDPFEENNG